MAGGAAHAHDTHPCSTHYCATRTDALATTSVLCICACAFYASAIHITAPIQRLLQRLLQPLVLRHLAWQRLLAQPLLHAIHRDLPAQQRPCNNIYRTSSAYALAPTPAASGLPCVACRAWGAPSFPPGLAGRGNSLRYRKQAQQKGLARYTASPALCAVRC